MVHSGGLTRNTLGGYFYPAGSPLCGSGQTCWSKLVEQWFSPPSLPRYKKTPLHAVRFFVFGALGWIRTTDRPVRSRLHTSNNNIAVIVYLGLWNRLSNHFMH